MSAEPFFSLSWAICILDVLLKVSHCLVAKELYSLEIVTEMLTDIHHYADDILGECMGLFLLKTSVNTLHVRPFVLPWASIFM